MPVGKVLATDGWPALDVRAAAFDRLGACAAVLDGEGVIVDTNRAWRLFAHLNDGSPLSTGVGVNYLDVCDRAAAAGVEVSGEVASGLRQILIGERDQIDAEYSCSSPTEDRWFMLQASALPVCDGAGAAVFHVDITARKQLSDRLVVLADLDALTGLPNRRAAGRYLDDGLALARATGMTVWVLFIDIDGFKSVNDTFGHHVGDELLVKVGLRADRALRDEDVLCRFGGDEFVVICPGADRDQMLAVAARLRTVMSAPFQIGEVELFGRISVGVAESSPTSTAELMFRAADQDMYVDKRRGGASPLHPAPRSSPDRRGPLGSRSVTAARVAQDPEVVGLSNELARAAAALRTSSELVIFFAADGTIEWASPACMNLFGFRPDDIVGLNGADLVHPDDQARAIAELLSIPNLGDQSTANFRVVDGLGRIRWIEETSTNLLDDPTVGSVVGNLRDVTERVDLLERVELDRRRLADAQAAARLGSFEIDLDTGDIARSDELCRILGVPIGSPANSSALDSIHPVDRPAVTALLHRAALGEERGELDYRIVRPTGEVRWVRTHGVRLPGPNTNLIAGTMLDITDRHEADAALTFHATHDWLTGLPNPVTLHDNLRHMLAGIEPGARVMVAVVGIDNFRQINDVSGSLTGDDALRSVAARIGAWTEPGDLIGRIRGDEFIVARNSHAAGTDAVEFGRQLKDMLGESPAVGDDHAAQPRLSFSVGITTTSGVDSPESIIADADAALNDAKRDGGDRVVVFDDDARARATRRRNIAAALALAIEHDELRLEYQPILDLTNLRTIGFEALIRWTHPDLGTISPAEFIPIAEADKLIGPIGMWVVEHAMQQLAEWRRDPRVSADLWMAINVSAQQLSQGRLADRVRESLERTGIPAHAMHLEITESVLMDRVDRAVTTITELHSLGVNISIDDFGTGYSSLSYLSRLPVNCLKIDRSFVHALSATRGGTSIVRAIINLAHSLELAVVAEGVETSQQLETLRELGCTNGQGFLWSRSLPPDDALHWMTEAAAPQRNTAQRRKEQATELSAETQLSAGIGELAVELSGCTTATITRARRRSLATTAEQPEVDPEFAILRLAAARSLLRAEAVEEAVGVVIGLVRDLGGSTIPARLNDRDALPLDCSFGHGEPLLARPDSVLARLRIEQILPEVLDDAREAIGRLRQRDDFAELSNTDPLTGLLNRRAVDQLLTRLRPDDAVVVIDIDNFKAVNDRWGHAVGDELLISFARALRSHCRPGDRFGRMGGDELLAVLIGAGRAGLDSFLDRLNETWRLVRPREVTYSAGAALVGRRTGTETLTAADTALYSAKSMGRDQVAVDMTAAMPVEAATEGERT